MIKSIFFASLLIVTALFSEPFVTAEFKGRLGNQLFQIAAAVSLALDNGVEAKFPNVLKNKDFKFNYEKVLWRINTDPLGGEISKTYREPSFNYAPIPYTPNMKISGYFQSEKYFKHHRDEIIDLFSPSDEIINYLESKYGDLIENPKAVAVHVRCYHLEGAHLSKIYSIYKKEYYLKIMKQFPENSLFIIFSDRIEWCKKEFQDCGYNIVYIEKEPPYHDIYLMSMFKQMIISNSTFSWWAAYINRHPDKVVIAPKKWLKPPKGNDSDLLPEGWIIVE